MPQINPDPFCIYVHAPWCRYRCPYCSFNIYISSNPEIENWKANVLRDWKKQQPSFSGTAHSLYFGGGTPSRINAKILRDIIQALPLKDHAEIGIELNPDDATPRYLSELMEAGFNRISLGVQSFQSNALKFLGRQHTTKQLEQVVLNISKLNLRSWSLDLIFGLPEHISYDLKIDLEQIARIRPPHVSLYGLTIEPNTHFERMVKKGKWLPLSSDKWVESYDRIVQFLSTYKYSRYEVSNFAQSGHRSQHNESIWRGGKYAGLGPGAHAYLPNGTRVVQHHDWSNWTQKGIKNTEQPDPMQQAIDLLITRIRHIDGLNIHALNQIGYMIPLQELTDFCDAELIHVNKNTISLGPAGWNVADAVSAKLVDLLKPLDSIHV